MVIKFLREARVRNILFSGTSGVDEIGDVEEFLKQVERLGTLHGLAIRDIWPFLGDLLKPPAARWFEQSISLWQSWKQVREAFLAAYAPSMGDAKTLQDMLGRIMKQGDRPIDFLSEIRKMYLSLTQNIAEKVVVDIAHRNLLPEYQAPLAFQDFSTIAQLEEACRRVEAALERGKDSQSRQSVLGKQGLAEVDILAMGCWNCGDTRHRFNSCGKPRGIFCTVCGQKGLDKSVCLHGRSPLGYMKQGSSKESTSNDAPKDQLAAIWEAVMALTKKVDQLKTGSGQGNEQGDRRE